MAGNCTREFCHPEETGCNHEGGDIHDCKYYKHGTESAAKGEAIQTVTESEAYVRFPWTGNTFGLQDLIFLTTTSNVSVIGVAGVASAGKTTFLATLYCLLRRGQKIGEYQFAGSLTLTGWENIAWYLSWKQHNAIQFPPHTTSNSGRIPGLLHLSLRNSAGEKKELIFTDAPGEWFDKWTVNQNDPDAQGAAWIHENADAFLLFADCDMLADIKQLGKARKQIKFVADRIKHNLGSRPFGLMWSKSDVALDIDIKAQISDHIKVRPYKEFETSVRPGADNLFHNNVLASIEWILSSMLQQTNELPKIPQQQTEDLFLSKR